MYFIYSTGGSREEVSASRDRCVGGRRSRGLPTDGRSPQPRRDSKALPTQERLESSSLSPSLPRSLAPGLRPLALREQQGGIPYRKWTSVDTETSFGLATEGLPEFVFHH